VSWIYFETFPGRVDPSQLGWRNLNKEIVAGQVFTVLKKTSSIGVLKLKIQK
jgi:hypothetical protein